MSYAACVGTAGQSPAELGGLGERGVLEGFVGDFWGVDGEGGGLDKIFFF